MVIVHADNMVKRKWYHINFEEEKNELSKDHRKVIV